MSIAIERIPETARSAWTRLRDELERLLGEDLVAMWAYGGTITAERASRIGDLDTFVVAGRAPDPSMATAIEAVHAAIAEETGVEWDAWYVLEDDARRREMPRHAFRDRLNESWAIDRAHWLAGRYVRLHGAEPSELVPPPTQSELTAALHAELDHLERHVAAGDTDPYEATYAFLNGCRILRALETGDVAISKREAGPWGLEHLEARWHPSLEAARRAYEGLDTGDDRQLLAREMAPFVVMVRRRASPPARRGR